MIWVFINLFTQEDLIFFFEVVFHFYFNCKPLHFSIICFSYMLTVYNFNFCYELVLINLRIWLNINGIFQLILYQVGWIEMLTTSEIERGKWCLSLYIICKCEKTTERHFSFFVNLAYSLFPLDWVSIHHL